jgi:aminoglycoside phosphotransferase (APT) family kinase protein
MHDDEVPIDVALVRRLVAAQFPQWSGLPIDPVAAHGTDNALYRLGEEMVVRLPRHAVSVPALRRELRWLPIVAPQVPLAVPLALATGVPGGGYPYPWAVLGWLAGEPATSDRLADGHQTTLDLASFIGALGRIDATDGPAPAGRGGPLGPRDLPMRAALSRLGDRIDARAVAAVWNDALRAPAWSGPGVWIHGDLDARNVLAQGGRISAVVDWGSMAIGDVACDVMVAWKMVPARERDTFRRTLGIDEPTWRRARGWVISQSLIALGYYTPENNPLLVDEAWRWYREVLADQPRR